MWKFYGIFKSAFLQKSDKFLIRFRSYPNVGYDKNYWIVFLAKLPLISKKYANYQSFKIVIWRTILLSKFKSLSCKTTLFFPL